MIKSILVALALFAAPLAQAQSFLKAPLFPGPTIADIIAPGGATDTGALRMMKKTVVLYDSGAVVTAGALDSGIIDTSGFEAAGVIVQSTDTTARTVAYTPYMPDGVTQMVAGGISLGTSTGPATFLQTQVATGNGTAAATMLLAPKSRWQLFAGASGTERLIVWAR